MSRAERADFFAKMPEPPILLAKWYDYAKWIIERVDSFPKNQRFIFGQRLAGHALDIMELLVEAAYARPTSGSSPAARAAREGWGTMLFRSPDRLRSGVGCGRCG